jgi:integrase
LTSNPKLIESQIIDYIVFLKNQKKVSYSHRMISLGAIKHFLRMNDVELRWYKILKYLGEDVSVVKDRTYTREEIKQILAKADERMRVVVLLLASTGMRISAIPDLTMRSLTRTTTGHMKLIFLIAVKRLAAT